MTENLVVLLLIGVVGVLSVVWTVFDAVRDLRRRTFPHPASAAGASAMSRTVPMLWATAADADHAFTDEAMAHGRPGTRMRRCAGSRCG